MKHNPRPPGTKRRWPRRLGWTAGILAVLGVIAYFVALSNAFIQGVILPKVSESLNASITVQSTSISPFSNVHLTGLRIQTGTDEPLLDVGAVHIHHSLWSILTGIIRVDEVTIDTPTIVLVQHPDGTTNLDPLLEAAASKAEEEKEPDEDKAESSPTQIQIGRVQLKNATLRYVQQREDGGEQVAEVSGLNFTLADLKNGQVGKLTLMADVKVADQDGAKNTNDLLTAATEVQMDIGLTPDLGVASLEGTAGLKVGEALGRYADLKAFNTALKCDLSQDEIRGVALAFKQADTDLGRMELKGPLNINTLEGQLRLDLLGIDRRILHLLTARTDMDFGATQVTSTNLVVLAEGGKKITAQGTLKVGEAGLTLNQRTTPILDLGVHYDVALDQTAGIATLQALSLDGAQNGKPFLSGHLSHPVHVSLNDTNAPADPAQLELTLTNFSIGDWGPFLEDPKLAGVTRANIQVTTRDSGQDVDLNLDVNLDEGSFPAGADRLEKMHFHYRLRAKLTGLNRLDMTTHEVVLGQADKEALRITLAGPLHFDGQEGDVTIKAHASLPALSQMHLISGADFAQGALVADLRLGAKSQETTLTGRVGLEGLTGRLNAFVLEDYNTTTELDVHVTSQAQEIRTVRTEIRSKGQPGGAILLTGKGSQSGELQMNVSLEKLNAHALAPFLEGVLSGQKVTSVDLNGTSTVHHVPDGPSRIQTDMALSNLILTPPGGVTNATTPLHAGIWLEATQEGPRIELAKGQITLAPTDRARNEIQFTGHFNQEPPEAPVGKLEIVADTLDITPYYDAFVGPTAPAPAEDTTQEPPSEDPDTPAPSAEPRTEPDPVNLPLGRFDLSLNASHVYLREIDLSALELASVTTSNRITVSPLTFQLNGAPVNLAMDLDMSVPGYRYSLDCDVNHVRLKPIANSLLAMEKDTVEAELRVKGTLKGAGVTEPNLVRNTVGRLNVGITNAHLEVTPKLVAAVITPFAMLLRLHDLPSSPFKWMNLDVQLDQGDLNLADFTVRSEDYSVTVTNQFQLDPALTNTVLPEFPVKFALERSVAAKSNLMPRGTPDDAAYVTLPDFVVVSGTLGKPEVAIKKLVLTGLLAKSTAGIPGFLGGKAGGLVEGFGSLLSGELPGSTNTVSDDSNLFIKILKTPGKTIQTSGDLIQDGSGVLGGPGNEDQKPAPAPPPEPPKEKEAPKDGEPKKDDASP